MEAIYALVAALAGVITLSTAVGMYLLNRLKRLEKKDEAADNAVRVERNQLRGRVTNLETRVEEIPRLQKRVNTLIGQLGEMQDRLAQTEAVAERRREESERLETINGTQRKQIVRLERENETYQIQITTYERALSLVRGRDSTEDKPDATLVTGAAGTEQIKQEK